MRIFSITIVLLFLQSCAQLQPVEIENDNYASLLYNSNAPYLNLENLSHDDKEVFITKWLTSSKLNVEACFIEDWFNETKENRYFLKTEEIKYSLAFKPNNTYEVVVTSLSNSNQASLNCVKNLIIKRMRYVRDDSSQNYIINVQKKYAPPSYLSKILNRKFEEDGIGNKFKRLVVEENISDSYFVINNKNFRIAGKACPILVEGRTVFLMESINQTRQMVVYEPLSDSFCELKEVE